MLKRIINYGKCTVLVPFHIYTQSSKSVCSRQYCDERFSTEEFKHWMDWRWKNYIVSMCSVPGTSMHKIRGYNVFFIPKSNRVADI